MAVHLRVTDAVAAIPLNRSILHQRCRQLLHQLQLDEAEVSVVLMGDAEMAGYNQQYRKKFAAPLRTLR